MHKHKAIMTDRRFQILKINSQRYKNKLIARKLNLSIENTKPQKWRLYCYLGDVHNAIYAINIGLQMGLLKKSDLAEAIREEIYGDTIKQKAQILYYPKR
ncbi:hypothetical protein [Campylobacter cuniculorum]|uniref:hypothetical protein n=1 Tax=Campylobacter cuniculorum TaxID=374106 RepID=UPI0023F40F3C|nr:hypothetical protein [Campylobacter cuniculorum]